MTQPTDAIGKLSAVSGDKGLHGYGKVWTYDDAPVRTMFADCDRVEIEEKVDGSQFSCGLVNGELVMRSRGARVFDGYAGMFEKAVASARRMYHSCDLLEGMVYRFEYLSKPKHNTLAYERVPDGNLVLYDAEISGEFCGHEKLQVLAKRLGVECVTRIYYGALPGRDELEALLNHKSALGGCDIEGVVIKDRSRRHLQDGKMLKAKVVSPAFKERHATDRKARNKTGKDIAQEIGDMLRTDARFEKAVQRARDAGNPADTVQSIGPLMADLGRDLKEEHEQFIKDRLFKHYWPKIQRKANAGFPEWFKAQLREAVTL